MMIYILMPKNTGNYYQKLKISYGTEKPLPYMSYSFNHYLAEIKDKIAELGDDWNIYKKYTNPYEYVHTNSYRTSVCKYKPISRAYFKLIEIINTFNFQSLETKAPMKMFALAEGPGGFIEAAINYREDNPLDTFFGMTIEDSNDSEVPGWKKSGNFLKAHPNVFLEKGADGTGNILNIDNFRHVVANFKGSVDFVTGDGGFDFSTDFNNQELSVLNLLFAQIAYAACIQKRGGSFVLKCFDCFQKATAELIFLLSSFYEKVYVTKPNTSRFANSERYIVCVNFLASNAEIIPIFDELMSNVSENPTGFVKSFFNGFRVPMVFYNKLEECNSVICQVQLDNIHNTISLIKNNYKNEKINHIMKTNLQKCIHWCFKNKVDFNANVSIHDFSDKKFFKKTATAEGPLTHSFSLADYEESSSDETSK